MEGPQWYTIITKAFELKEPCEEQGNQSFDLIKMMKGRDNWRETESAQWERRDDFEFMKQIKVYVIVSLLCF